MVKADLTRDYYGDLELPPNADANDIKRQFKKLALLYHPDRNPGHENEVTARFQKIQSAHEVLTDPHERSKYDANRSRNMYRTGGNQRGNPWSNVSSQFPTPPKAPTRARPQQPPPPSAGAQRYKHFETPRQSANQSAQEGAEARRSTYEAWERMRDRNPPAGQASSKPAPPPRKAASNTSRPSPTAKAPSQNSSQRKGGFTPSTPGGDEPAAPRTAYATHREKPMHAPPPPSDTQPSGQGRSPAEPSRRHSKAKSNVQFEPRMSTPYATHGGEKFNPFENLNMNRSKSTRVPSSKYQADGMPRVGSDPNLNAGQRPRPHSTNFSQSGSTFTAPGSDESSSDSGPQIKKKATPRATPVGARTFAKARSFTGTRAKPSPFTTSPVDGQAKEPGQPADANTSAQEPPLTSGQTNPQQTSEPSMYDTPRTVFSTPRGKVSTHGERLPTVSEQVPSSPKDFSPSPRSQYLLSRGELRSMWPEGLPRIDDKKSASPKSRQALFPLEETQRSVLDVLITKRNSMGATAAKESNASDVVSSCKSDSNERETPLPTAFTHYRESPIIGSPPKKQKQGLNQNPHRSTKSYYSVMNHNVMDESATNSCPPARFSFNVDESTFNRTNPGGFKPPGTEPLNTTFSPSDWEAKFESNHFAPAPNATGGPKFTRQHSGSRTRGRSPTKSRSGEKPMHAHVDEESTESSPGSTKFSQEDWAKTFNPRTFMPPQTSAGARGGPRTARKGRVPSIKPTMGTAAVVDDGDTSDDKPLFKGRNATASEMSSAPSPDPMDVDTPSATAVPGAAEDPKNDGAQGHKVGPSSGQTRDDEFLKVNFQDLQIQDLISTLNLPPPPAAVPLPSTPEAREAYPARFKAYMRDWDTFNGRMMLHLVARKSQNDVLAATRWLNTDGISFYRKGLQEDSAVLKWWNDAVDKHCENMKQCQVLRSATDGPSKEGSGVGQAGAL